jgi:hypothetical protein
MKRPPLTGRFLKSDCSMNIIGLPSFADVTDFLIIIGAAVLVALVWFFLFRSKLMHRHKHHHRRRSQRKLNPTLAQTGGLPPRREEKNPADQTPPP